MTEHPPNLDRLIASIGDICHEIGSQSTAIKWSNVKAIRQAGIQHVESLLPELERRLKLWKEHGP